MKTREIAAADTTWSKFKRSALIFTSISVGFILVLTAEATPPCPTTSAYSINELDFALFFHLPSPAASHTSIGKTPPCDLLCKGHFCPLVLSTSFLGAHIIYPFPALVEI